MSAALAYYAVFSIAPLLVITISMIGIAFGDDAARGQVADQLSGLVGNEAALTIQDAVEKTGQSKSSGIWATVVGTALLIFGATTVFAELKASLNNIWGVAAAPGRAIWTILRDRLLSFSMVLCIGFLLLMSLALSSILTGMSVYFAEMFGIPPVFWKSLDFIVSLGVISLLFVLIFKILPDVILQWRDVWVGAVSAALLFTIGKSLLAWYLGTNAIASSFGAAGSLVVLLLWFYYATCILFFGAEIVKVCVQNGKGIVLKKHAVKTGTAGEPEI